MEEEKDFLQMLQEKGTTQQEEFFELLRINQKLDKQILSEYTVINEQKKVLMNNINFLEQIILEGIKEQKNFQRKMYHPIDKDYLQECILELLSQSNLNICSEQKALVLQCSFEGRVFRIFLNESYEVQMVKNENNLILNSEEMHCFQQYLKSLSENFIVDHFMKELFKNMSMFQ